MASRRVVGLEHLIPRRRSVRGRELLDGRIVIIHDAGFGEVPPVGRRPLVVHAEGHGSTEGDDRGFVGEDVDHPTPPLQLHVEPLERVGRIWIEGRKFFGVLD